MKLSSTKILNLHMNIIVKCSTKWVEMCSAMLLCKHLSHVFPAVCKIQSDSKHEGAERTVEEVWAAASVTVLLSHASLKRMWRHLMQRHCARRTIIVWHRSREQMLRVLSNRSRGTMMSYADRLRGAAPRRTHTSISPSVRTKKR